MAEERKNTEPTTVMEFELSCAGIKNMSFAKVTNIVSSIEYDSVECGGIDITIGPHIMPMPKKRPDVLVLERAVRGILEPGDFKKLKLGARLNNIIICVYREGKLVRVYGIDAGVVVKREFSSLDALSNQIFMEKLEIAHNGLVEVK